MADWMIIVALASFVALLLTWIALPGSTKVESNTSEAPSSLVMETQV